MLLLALLMYGFICFVCGAIIQRWNDDGRY